MPTAFDLEKALAAWRRSLVSNRVFSADDLDELEQHLRDQVVALVRGGWTAEAAFAQAQREMGATSAPNDPSLCQWRSERRSH